MRRNTTVPVHLTWANGAEEAAGPLSKYCDKNETEGVGGLEPIGVYWVPENRSGSCDTPILMRGILQRGSWAVSGARCR